MSQTSKGNKKQRFKVVEDTRTLLRIYPGKGKYGLRAGGSKPGTTGASGTRVVGPEGLARILHAQDRQRMYKEKETGTRCFKQRTPISYEMCFEPKHYQFFMSVPTSSYRSVSEHIKKDWEGATIKVEEDDYIEQFADAPASYCEVEMDKYYIFPMKFAQGEPLNSLINVASGLREGEKMMVQLMMIPLKTSWQIKARDLLYLYEDTGVSTPSKGMEGFFKEAEDSIVDVLDTLTCSLFGLKEEERKPRKSIAPSEGELKSIRAKLSESAFRCMIRIYAIGESSQRRTEILTEAANALRVVEGINVLAPARIHHQVPLDVARRYTGFVQELAFNRNVLTISEIAGMLQAPDSAMMERYPQIDRSQQQSLTPPPPHMFEGLVPVGVMNPDSDPKIIYWDHRDMEKFMVTKIAIGAPGSGKTTFLQTYIHCLKRLHHGVFVFDIIEKCGLTREIAESLDPEDYEIWDLETEWTQMSFDYCELYRNFDEDKYIARKIRANEIAGQIIKLLNALNGAEFTDRMEKVVRSVAKIVFTFKDQTLNDFIKVLRFADVREEAIERAKRVPKNSQGQELFTREDIEDLDILEKKDKEGNKTGETDMDIVNPILTRLAVLSEDPRTYQMLNNKPAPKYDMEEAVLKNKIILIRVPQTASEEGELGFSEQTRAMITAFFSFKLWLVKQGMMAGRDENKLVMNPLGEMVPLRDLYVTHMVYDEVHQIPETLNVLGQHMKEFRKFRLTPMFTCHGLTNFDKKVVSEISKLGAAFLMLAPTDPETIETLVKSPIRGLTFEDISEMDKYYLTAHVPAGNNYLSIVLKSPGTIQNFEALEKELEAKKRKKRKKTERRQLTPAQRFFAQLQSIGIHLDKAEDAPIDKLLNTFGKWFSKTANSLDGDPEVLEAEIVESMIKEELEIIDLDEMESGFELVVAPEEPPLVKCQTQSNPSMVKWIQQRFSKPQKTQEIADETHTIQVKEEAITVKPDKVIEIKTVQKMKESDENPFVKRAREQAERYRQAKPTVKKTTTIQNDKTPTISEWEKEDEPIDLQAAFNELIEESPKVYSGGKDGVSTNQKVQPLDWTQFFKN